MSIHRFLFDRVLGPPKLSSQVHVHYLWRSTWCLHQLAAGWRNHWQGAIFWLDSLATQSLRSDTQPWSFGPVGDLFWMCVVVDWPLVLIGVETCWNYQPLSVRWKQMATRKGIGCEVGEISEINSGFNLDGIYGLGTQRVAKRWVGWSTLWVGFFLKYVPQRIDTISYSLYTHVYIIYRNRYLLVHCL